MKNNYFFIDGLALLSDIKKYKLKNIELKEKKLDIQLFVNHIFSIHTELRKFHEGSYRRAVFYFVKMIIE